MVEEILRKKMEGAYSSLEEFLEEKGIDIEDLVFKLEAEKRIEMVKEFCDRYGYNFSQIYSSIEKMKDEKLREHALRSAVAAILARDGPVATSDLGLYKEIRERIKNMNKYGK